MTALLALQYKNRVLLAGDTRITNDAEYTDGVTKVFKVSNRVLVGVCGDANLIDPFRMLLPDLRKCQTALEAARTLRGHLQAMSLPKELEYSFLFVSRGSSAEISDTGLMEFPMSHGKTARAGSGGLVADVYWHTLDRGLESLKDAQESLQEAVAEASHWTTSCGPETRLVMTTP